MTEPASLALGVVALYTFVDKGLSALSRAKDYGKVARELRAKLLIEEVKLNQWGRSWGYPDSDMDANLQEACPRLHKAALIIFEEIANTLGDVDKLKSKYGLQHLAETPLETSKPVKRSTTDPISINKSLEEASMIKSSLDRPFSTRRPNFNAGLLTKGKWAIHGASKLEALIQDLKEWNDSLSYFQPPRQQQSLDLALTAALLECKGPESVELLLEAAKDAGPDVLVQMAALRRYVLELEQNLLKPAISVTDRHLLLYQNRLKLSDGDAAQESPRITSEAVEIRQFGTYQLSGDSPVTTVLVEWKSIPAAVKAEHRFVYQTRIQQLARLLHESTKKPPGFCVLPCLGMVLGEDGSYGLAFVIPSTAPCRGISLQDMLRGSASSTTIAFEPPLRSRLALALQLCTCFLRLHSASWLHKRFSSRNVLFFPRDDSTGKQPITLPDDALEEPHLTCFSFSRPAADGFESISLDAFTSLPTTIDDARQLGDALYAHPASIGPARSKFCCAFDIYALSFVLLEIGLWTRLDALVPVASRLKQPPEDVSPSYNVIEAIHDYIIQRYLNRLKVSIGGIFEDVVRWCLKGQFESTGDEIAGGEGTSEFYWKVIWPLQKCKI